MEYGILALCFIIGMIVELFLSRKRARQAAEGNVREVAKEALFVFGRVPSENVAILSGLRVLFLILFWGCIVGLVSINIAEGKGAFEYLFTAGASVAGVGITLLFNFAIRSFREMGIFFLEDELVFRRFSTRKIRYHEIREALESASVMIRFNFMRIPVVSGGAVKIPVADLRTDRNAYGKLCSYLESKYGIQFPGI